jgi:hypothetical protein
MRVEKIAYLNSCSITCTCKFIKREFLVLVYIYFFCQKNNVNQIKRASSMQPILNILKRNYKHVKLCM